MTAIRRTPTQALDPVQSHIAFGDRVSEEVEALWALLGGVLENVAGTANAITADASIPIGAYTDGLRGGLVPVANNTGAVSIAWNGLPVKALRDSEGSILAPGAIVSGRYYPIEYILAFDHFRISGGDSAGVLGSETAAMVWAKTFANGVAGGTATQGSWLIYILNTEVLNELSAEGAALNTGTGVMTLPAGTYDLWGVVPFHDTDLARIRLWNITDAVAISLAGSTVRATTANEVKPVTVAGRFTLNATKTLRLEYRVSTTKATDGLGLAASFGETEKYGYVFITRPGEITADDFGSIAGHNLTISTAAPSGGGDGDIWFQVPV